MSDSSDAEIRKGRPPKAWRFKPGQSGNPNGRPRGKRRNTPYERILGQMVTIRENGEERRMRADAAFMLHITTKGLGGDGVMARAAFGALKKNINCFRRSARTIQIVYSTYAEPGDLRHAVRNLRIAAMLDPYRPSAKLVLETWIIEEALVRLGDQQLSLEQQQVVVSAARTPHKVRWPDWWSALPR